MQAALSPIAVGPLELRNRVVVPAHTTNFAVGNLPTPRHAAYHAARAAGGAGLIVTEAVRVHPTSAGRRLTLVSFDDSSTPGFAAIAAAVHGEGAHIVAQLMHLGRQADGAANRTVAWSPSSAGWAPGSHTPHAMGRRELRTVVECFAAAARRMAVAGYDALEVHAGHGHLLQQFLSPATNTRKDAYGGDLDGRMRLTREVLSAVTAAAPRLPVGLRVSADEFLDGGLQPDAVIEIVARLRAEFALLYVHVSHSAYHGWSLSTQIADMSFGHAPFREHAARFKQALPGLPVIAVCRLDSVAEAGELIAAGEADLVALARPHIADPELVRKTQQGRLDEVNSCLACNQACIGRVELNLPISCVVNPEVGAEAEWRAAWGMLARPHPARRVLVVGGGPAGMEAAISARRAGHRVVLVEQAPWLGGQIHRAAAVPGRERLGLLVRDRARELSRRGVEVRLGTRADEALVCGGEWDHVVIATGSRPSPRAFAPGPPVHTTWQAAALVADGRGFGPGAVVVLDDEGGWAGASLAEQIAELGSRVHLVSPTPALAPRITTYSRLALVPRLAAAGVQVHLMQTASAGPTGCVVLTDAVSGCRSELTGVVAIVDAGPAVAVDELYRVLDAAAEPSSVPVPHVVGDANAPRTAAEAVYEGRLAGAFLGELDSPEAQAVLAAT